MIYAATAGINGIALAALPSPGGDSFGGLIDLVTVRLAEIPLPAALPLFLLGAAGLGAFRVRRRQS